MDWLYDHLFVRPYSSIANYNKKDFIDSIYNFLADTIWVLHDYATTLQTGQLRTYLLVMVGGLVLLIAVFLGALLS